MNTLKVIIFVLLFAARLDKTFNNGDVNQNIVADNVQLLDNQSNDVISYMRHIHFRKKNCHAHLKLLLLLLSGDCETNPGPDACSAFNCSQRRPKKDENSALPKVSFHK